jgi:exosortase
MGEGVRIEEEAVVIGPAVIGPNCRIGRGAVVAESVLWEGSVIEDGAAITECLVDAGAVVGAGVEAAGVWCRGILARRDRAARGQDARATFAARGQDARATFAAHGQDARATFAARGQDARATFAARGQDARATFAARGQDARATFAAHGQDARATFAARGQDARATGTSFGHAVVRVKETANKVVEDVETVLMKIWQAAAARLSAALGDRISAKAWWWMGAAAVATCFLWSYWNPTVVSLWRLWLRSDEFSSGLLVPFLAVYILWSRWRTLEGVAVRPAIAWGLAAFAVAQAMRFFGLWLMYGSAENLSLVASICALVLLLFGWKVVWRVWPVLAFLLLMLPFPHRVQGWITQPLQRWATSSAVFGLEMLGFEVGRQGNVIDLNGTMVAVAEACNGLRMLTAFVVIAALVALVVERRWWEKAIIVASSVPIAFACNTLRLVITAIAFTRLNTEAWEKAFHDFGGLAMMPVALAMVMGLLWLMGQVVVREEGQERLPQVVKKGRSGEVE